ncbi:AAR2 protein-domain-containing protein [Podospora didyma]|uniref:AAR2 protein-domain-containing protein n=1 Tax=Podospora didyma TaxID=330526 RepID=A0AAE0N9A8_9PEZI|nr:AAR2 protein-domain-containing protein [Podospora didyma]
METRDSTAEEADPAKCLIRGDVFRLLDLDGKFMIGHDNMTVSTNTKPICGFRDIPPGPHFLWVQQREAISRCGYWYITGDRGVVRVRQWDAYNEVLGDVASQFEVRMQKANIDTIYSELIPYSLGGGRNSTPNLKSTLQSQSPNFETDPAIMWHSLTAAISERFLNRVTNKKGVDAWLIDSSDCVKWDGNSNMPQPLATATVSQAYKLAVGSMLNFLFSQDFQTLRLLDIGGSNQAAVDTSTRILALLNSKTDAIGDDDIAAELQFTFLTGTHLGNAACLEQWWNLVLKIVLRSYKLCLWRPALCCSMLKTLHAQLVYTEDYVDISHQENGHARAPPTEGPSSERLLFQFKPQNRRKLHKALALYKHQLNEMLLGEGNQIKPEQVATGQAFENLEAWLYRRGWDLRSGDVGDGEVISADDSDDDDAPVIVELDEDGHEVGLVSFSRD